MRNLRTSLLLAAAALLPGAAGAFFGQDYAGTATAQFLKLGADPRGAAMGEAMGAAADDAAALYWNPAGLAALEEREVEFHHAFLYQSVFCDYIAYAHPIQPIVPPTRRELKPSGLGTVALSALYLNAGQIEEVDNTASPTGGAFTPRDVALAAGWGSTVFENVDLGFAVKYIDSRIQNTARTGAADFGARFRFLILDVWPYAIAFSGSNFGGKLRYNLESDPLPATLRVGQTLRPTKHWLLSFDLVDPSDNKIYPNAGTEFSVPFGEDITGFLRAGYSGRVSGSDLEGLASASFGFGLRVNGLGFDYTWAPYGLLGQANRLGVSYKF